MALLTGPLPRDGHGRVAPAARIPNTQRIQDPAPRWKILAAAAIIATAALAAYANSFPGPFVFDDVSGIAENATIRTLSRSFVPPLDATSSGRPFLNFTLALNFAAGGLDVRGYHAVNLLIHILAGLTLFGILRRTFARVTAGGPPELPALAATLLWILHPLQTESVTYLVQRAESLMGLFYLLTVYCFIRGATSEKPRFWLFAAILACLLGAATKEVIVSAPLIILLYDRAFIAGSIREALRQRWKTYAGLACIWPELLLLVRTTQSRNGSSGFGIGVRAWDYYLTQFPAVVGYLRLSAWPHPLVFDYGTEWAKNPWAVAVTAAIVAALLAGTIVALWRWPAIGLAGACFFSILAPTSLIPGNRQTMAEHRMYLALVPIVALSAAAAWRLGNRRGIHALLAMAFAFGWLTFRRNEAYASGVALWSDTVAKRPDNPHAQADLAGLLAGEPGRQADAMVHYETALRLKPDFAEAHNNLAALLASQPGRQDEAIAHYETALRLKPDYAEAHDNLGLLLAGQPGRQADAIAHYETSLRLKPDLAEAHNNLGLLLAGQPGRQDEAIAHYETALRLKPDLATAHTNLANLLAGEPDRQADAIAHYEATLRLNPNLPEVHNNLGLLLTGQPGRQAEAIAHFEAALRLKPDYALAHTNLANLLAGESDRQADAIVHYETALRLRPDLADAHNNLGLILASQPGRQADAIAHFEAAARLMPDSLVIHFNLARELEKLPNRRAEAAVQYRAALKINPDFAPAREALQRLQQDDR